jgi:ferrochelatase
MRTWKEKGAKTHVVASFGFVFDHLEVLYDLDIVTKKFADDLGVVYRRVPEPNSDPKLITALVAVAVRALRSAPPSKQ